MEDFFETLTDGNVTEVKVVLTCVIAALVVYQLVLITVGYGVVRIPFLDRGPATLVHRLTGDALVVVTAVVSVMCLAVFGFDDDGGTHAISGVALAAALVLKILVVRTASSDSKALPPLGGLLFVLFAITCWTSAADYFGDDD